MRVIRKINSELAKLPLSEKLEYWFQNVFPNITPLPGKPELARAKNFFKTSQLIPSPIGYMPSTIYKKNFNIRLENTPVFVEYMADRYAKRDFEEQKSIFEENIRINGENYVLEWLDQCKNKGNTSITEFEIVMGLKSIEDLRSKFFHQRYLEPFLIQLQNGGNSPLSKPQRLGDLVSEERMKLIFRSMEDLSITKNGKWNGSDRRKSILRGYITAAKIYKVLPDRSLDVLAKLLAAEIEMPYVVKLKDSDASEEMRKKAERYFNSALAGLD